MSAPIILRITTGLLAATLLASCSPSGASIALFFPNEAAHAATKQLAVYAFSRDVVGVSVIDIRCRELLGRIRRGEQIPGDPIDNPFEPPFDNKQIPGFPQGDPVIYVVGYNELGDEKRPIVEGCTEDFETGGNDDEVPIKLSVIIPDEVTIEKVAGDRQVGHPGEALPVDLKVRLRGSLPGARMRMHALPGLTVAFVPDATVRLPPQTAPGSQVEVISDVDGLAQIGVSMPDQPGTFKVEADVQQIDALAAAKFQVSAIDAVDFSDVRTVALGGAAGFVVSVGFGNVVGDAASDLVILSCGSDEAHCTGGTDAMDPPGATQLMVLDDALGSPPTPSAMNLGELGHLPAKVLVGNFIPPTTYDDIAILNSRRVLGPNDISEGAEIRMIAGAAAGVRLTGGGRYTLTASNAVAMVPYVARPGDTHTSLLAVGQGARIMEPRRCRREPICLPPDLPDCGVDQELCGCMPNERCECPRGMSCLDTNTPGLCVADDRTIDRFDNLYDRGTHFMNTGGCHRPQLECMKPEGTDVSTCACGDSFRGNNCNARDSCYCRVPDRILIGVAGSAHFPYDLAVGPLTGSGEADIVVATEGGIDFIEASGTGAWTWRSQPVINNVTHDVEVPDMDGNTVPDVVWYSRLPCHQFSNRVDPCPIVLGPNQVIGAKDEAGCIGVLLRAGVRSIDEVKNDGCRRFPVAFVPDGMCIGDFNGDGGKDVALASANSPELAIMLGDGGGGLLSPPDLVALGPNPESGAVAGGPITCGQLDGDNRDDIVVINRATGDIVILGTQR